MSEPSDALIEAMAAEIARAEFPKAWGGGMVLPRDRDAARAAYAAMVEHLGLRVGTSGRLISTKGTEVEP